MRACLIVQAIAAVAQCLLVWLVVTVTNRKLDRECGEALKRWKAADRNAAASLDGVLEMLARQWARPARATMPSVNGPNGPPCRFRALPPTRSRI